VRVGVVALDLLPVREIVVVRVARAIAQIAYVCDFEAERLNG
jgi:hypothetical protein